jgi:hypothetical protein
MPCRDAPEASLFSGVRRLHFLEEGGQPRFDPYQLFPVHTQPPVGDEALQNFVAKENDGNCK